MFAEELHSFFRVLLRECVAVVAVNVEDADACVGRGAFEVVDGEDEFADVAGVAGDVVFAQDFDVGDDEGFLFAPAAAAHAFEGDGAAGGFGLAADEGHGFFAQVDQIKAAPACVAAWAGLVVAVLGPVVGGDGLEAREE